MEAPLRIRALHLSHFRQLGSGRRAEQRDKEPIPKLPRHSPAEMKGSRVDDRLSSSSRHLRLGHRSSQALIEEQRRRYLHIMLAPAVADNTIHSPAAFRETFFGSFVNDLTWMQATPFRYPVLQRLRTFFNSGHPDGPFAAAIDAILLAQFSLTLRDAQYSAEARWRYGLAMSRCARRLAAKPRRLEDWVEVLTAIQALGTCEMYDHLSQGGEVWIRHSDGILAILRQLSIRSHDLTDDHLKMTIYNAIDASLKTAIWARRPSVFAEQPWFTLISSNCEGRGWCLQHTVCHLPTLLSQMEDMQHKDVTTHDVVGILNKLLTIERDLLHWLHAWYVTCPKTLIYTTKVESFSDFTRKHKDTASTFSKVFDFPSPVEALGHLVYYEWLSIVRQAICELHFRLDSSDLISKAAREHALLKATECADAACMLAPYSSQMEGTEPSKSLLQVLELAEVWYEKSGQRDKLRYVREIFVDGTKQEKHHQSTRWPDVNGFFVRRLVLQHCIGPHGCVLRDYAT